MLQNLVIQIAIFMFNSSKCLSSSSMETTNFFFLLKQTVPECDKFEQMKVAREPLTNLFLSFKYIQNNIQPYRIDILILKAFSDTFYLNVSE